jgi:phosphatidylserine decarboxylase
LKVLKKIPVARDALPYVAGFAAAAVLSYLYISPFLAALWLVMLGLVALFFRDPERVVHEIEDAILAPADGRVVQLGHSAGGKALSIFLSLLDVHVNRAPVSGLVESVVYHRGSFNAAFRPGASERNERNIITIRAAFGPVTAIQIAGLLARRIVCTVRAGDRVRAGERIGLIKFGSRVDVLVPDCVAWNVGVGSRVRGGLTVIGTAGAGSSREGPSAPPAVAELAAPASEGVGSRVAGFEGSLRSPAHGTGPPPRGAVGAEGGARGEARGLGRGGQ